MRRTARLSARGAAVLVAVVLAAPAAGPAAAAAPVQAPAQVTPTDLGAQIKVLSRSEYVDPLRNRHLLGELINTGPLVESIIVHLDLLDASGRRIGATDISPPLGWLKTGGKAPFDKAMPPDQQFATWRVRDIDALPAQREPTQNFAFLNLTGPQGAGDSQIIRGTIRNDNGYRVDIVKVAFTFHNASGGIVFYQNTVAVPVNASSIGPGESVAFSIPRTYEPPGTDIGRYAGVAEGNEPGSPTPSSPARRAAGGPLPTVRRAPGQVGLVPTGQVPPSDPRPRAGVPAPSASDLAAAANPPAPVMRTAPAPVRAPAGPPPPIIDPQPAAATGPSYASSWVPALLILGIGGVALLLLGRQLAAWRGARAERRRLRRDAAAAGAAVPAPQAAAVAARRTRSA
jgi:hypothetical protein